MIPVKSDPIWRTIILDTRKREFTALPTKMLMMRVALMISDGTPEKIDEAISIAYDFFQKNQKIVKKDIELLFGIIDEGQGQ